MKGLRARCPANNASAQGSTTSSLRADIVDTPSATTALRAILAPGVADAHRSMLKHGGPFRFLSAIPGHGLDTVLFS